MSENCNCLVDSMTRYIGQTVTVFTTSGGISGSGFTGVLAGIHNCCVRLITDIGAAPACPCGSSCGGAEVLGARAGRAAAGRSGGCGCGGSGGGYSGYGFGGNNWLGSVTEIPADRIVSFTHNAL